MQKQIIGITTGYNYLKPWNEDHVINGKAGGSETVIVSLANTLQLKGFLVLLFGMFTDNCINNFGVNYIKLEELDYYITTINFDAFIFYRYIDLYYALAINTHIIHIFLEDLSYGIFDKNMFITNTASSLYIANKKINYLFISEYYNFIFNTYNLKKIPFNYIVFKNCIDHTLYNNINMEEKENMMVWSSRKERNLIPFIKYVFPIIKEKIQDFTLHICNYDAFNFSNYFDNDIFKQDGIIIHNYLSKKDLSDLLKKAKIWIYPNNGYIFENNDYTYGFHETFCNTAVENALAKNIIVCFDLGGLSTTLKNYKGLIHVPLHKKYYDNFYRYCIDKSRLNDTYKDLGNTAVEILTNYNNYTNYIEQLVSIGRKYEYNNTTCLLIDILNLKKKDCIIVIPIYTIQLKNYEIKSLLQVSKIIGKQYTICIVCPDSLNIENILPIFNDNNILIYRFEDKFFKDTITYSELLTDYIFYEHFLDYNYMLIYLQDGYIFKNDILKFIDMNYDYYGAIYPFIHTDAYNCRFSEKLRNGGISLRKVKKLYDVCKKYGKIINKTPEDVYFTVLHCNDINVAPADISVLFSLEHLPNNYTKEFIEKNMPMCIHNWYNYLPDMYKEFIENN